MYVLILIVPAHFVFAKLRHQNAVNFPAEAFPICPQNTEKSTAHGDTDDVTQAGEEHALQDCLAFFQGPFACIEEAVMK